MRATIAGTVPPGATLRIFFVSLAVFGAISACDREPQPTKRPLSESRPSAPPSGPAAVEPREVHLATDVKSPAKWAKEPTAFQRVPFGSSLQAADAMFKFIKCYPQDKDDTECSGDVIPIGQINTVPEFTFNSRNQFVAVRLTQYTNEFDYLKDVFVERYGKPTKTRTGVSKTG
ncbi:MAG TPA: hypothetical protein VHX14_03190, partial [Thermoanaerobaculia bacterium]|nr:hypothetical protein [Thermoanaerobaculia bacterium]